MSEVQGNYGFQFLFFYFDIENSKELNRELVRDIYKWKEEDKEVYSVLIDMVGTVLSL